MREGGIKEKRQMKGRKEGRKGAMMKGKKE